MGRIVVGVDASPEAEAALRWAVEEARLRHAIVEVVHAWLFPGVGEVPGRSISIAVSDVEHDATQQLDRIVDAVVGADPEVKVERRVIEGSAAPVLVDAAAGADLLVIGSRGHGGFVGLLLGSVAQQCVHHAPCPVVVVR
ncbi:MAG TPA: universal stress protein [Acidimicrobiia bacterium]|nr:universal stress protein [Acidimicrobiia bacterium]